MRYGWHARHSWPDASHTPSAPVACLRMYVCLCVCVCLCVRVFLVQSSTVRRSRGLDSADQTLSPGDKDPPVLVRFHEHTDFTRSLICAHTLSACHNLFILHLSSPVPPLHLSSAALYHSLYLHGPKYSTNNCPVE